LLVVPAVLPGLRVQRNDRRREQVVTAARRADLRGPGRTVAGTDVDQLGGRVVVDGVPGRAAAARFPPLAAPGLRGPGQFGLLEALRRIPGHGPPAPQLFAAVGAVGGQVAALLELRARLTDEDAAIGDARRTGDRERLLWIGRLDFPDFL